MRIGTPPQKADTNATQTVVGDRSRNALRIDGANQRHAIMIDIDPKMLEPA